MARWLLAVGKVPVRCVPSTVTAPAIELICHTTSFHAELDTWFPFDTVGRDHQAAAAKTANAAKTEAPAAKPIHFFKPFVKSFMVCAVKIARTNRILSGL